MPTIKTPGRLSLTEEERDVRTEAAVVEAEQKAWADKTTWDFDEKYTSTIPRSHQGTRGF